MKHIALLLTCILLTCIVLGQEKKYQPALAPGKKLNYTIAYGSMTIPLDILLEKLGDTCRLQWEMPDGSKGWLLMKKKSIENGTQSYWSQPAANMETDMDDEETVLIFSKTFFKTLLNFKSAVYDGIAYHLKAYTDSNAFQLGNKVVDAVYAESADGITKIWLLNSADFPLLLKIIGNKAGIDAILNSISE